MGDKFMGRPLSELFYKMKCFLTDHLFLFYRNKNMADTNSVDGIVNTILHAINRPILIILFVLNFFTVPIYCYQMVIIISKKELRYSSFYLHYLTRGIMVRIICLNCYCLNRDISLTSHLAQHNPLISISRRVCELCKQTYKLDTGP